MPNNVGHRFTGNALLDPTPILRETIVGGHFFETRVQHDPVALKCFGEQDFGVKPRVFGSDCVEMFSGPFKQSLDRPLISRFSHQIFRESGKEEPVFL
jgi:hypothetical protein